VRDFGEGDYPRDPKWRAGFAHLERHDLVACLDSSPETYASIRSLAAAFPNIVISLDHAGFPRRRDAEYFAMWKRELTSLAEAPNVVVKISGLGMADADWTVVSFRPWVMTCIETFGVERSFFGTNWPVDRLFSSYVDVLDAYEAIVAGFSRHEQMALLGYTHLRPGGALTSSTVAHRWVGPSCRWGPGADHRSSRTCRSCRRRRPR
jgi:predicted TIM-barrel fold metal-dependent hydrolase